MKGSTASAATRSHTGSRDDALPAGQPAGGGDRVIRGDNALPFIGAPEDIAKAIRFLASDTSRYVTGQVIVVDGGMCSHSATAEDRRTLLSTRG